MLDSDVIVLIIVLLEAFLLTRWYNEQPSFFVLKEYDKRLLPDNCLPYDHGRAQQRQES